MTISDTRNQRSMTLPPLPSQTSTNGHMTLPPELMKYMNKTTANQYGQPRGCKPTQPNGNISTYLKHPDVEKGSLDKKGHPTNESALADLNDLGRIVSDIDKVCENSDRLRKEIDADLKQCLKTLDSDCDSTVLMADSQMSSNLKENSF